MNIKQTILQYYDKSFILYKLLWSSRYLHYGIWDWSTFTRSRALENTCYLVVDKLNIRDSDVVLDAGCGVGGISRFISQNHGALVVGISLSQKQIDVGNKLLNKVGSKDKRNIQLEVGDFHQMRYGDQYFDKIFFVESICHSYDPELLTKELYRVLKKGGKLVVIDGFRSRSDISGIGKSLYQKALSGWAISVLYSSEEWKSYFLRSGFNSIKYKELTKSILPSSVLLFLIGIIGYPFVYILFFLKIVPNQYPENALTSILQRYLFSRKYIEYGILEVTK